MQLSIALVDDDEANRVTVREGDGETEHVAIERQGMVDVGDEWWVRRDRIVP
ncbi:MAG TPA: hypothetical protein VMF30_14630 [Pirellulales bacterium]|nr:hypothetical protein [Pirellulales bacterium]